jgi:hypothetical protein
MQVTPLNQMSYDEFGKLRFLDFFPNTDLYHKDDVGGLECGIGIACSEGYGPTFFARPQRSRQTAEIGLDFDDDCPEMEGHALLDRLGLNLRCGMPGQQIKDLLGTPESDQPRWLRFVVGSKWPYYVGCLVDDAKGLCRVWICRKDLADKEERLQNGESDS